MTTQEIKRRLTRAEGSIKPDSIGQFLQREMSPQELMDLRDILRKRLNVSDPISPVAQGFGGYDEMIKGAVLKFLAGYRTAGRDGYLAKLASNPCK